MAAHPEQKEKGPDPQEAGTRPRKRCSHHRATASSVRSQSESQQLTGDLRLPDPIRVPWGILHPRPFPGAPHFTQ